MARPVGPFTKRGASSAPSSRSSRHVARRIQDKSGLELYLSLYSHMLTARAMDQAEHEVTNRGEAFFHLSASGHEGSVALVPHLTEDDWLHLHYRDRALLLARGVTPRTMFASLLCKQDSPSRGRQMSPFLSDRKLHVLSQVTPTGNGALQAVGVAAAVRDQASRPIVLCGVGDGTTQQGEVLEAMGEAVRDQLPVLFFIHDNHWAISTGTRGRTFFSLPGGKANAYLGTSIHYLDGRDVVQSHGMLGRIIQGMRKSRKPALVVFEVERLDSHTNADDQRIYRDADDIQLARETGDPIRHMEHYLLGHGCTGAMLEELRLKARSEVSAAEVASSGAPDPLPVFGAKCDLPDALSDPNVEVRGVAEGAQLPMKDAMREVLREWLANDPRVCLLGEDIEDPKGDVFGVTMGLSTEFPGRVRNAALSESTIIGSSIGRALVGERPVAFLQFADFMPQAFNQIVSELGTIHWRTDGEYSAPVIVMAACGGYRPGLGPYHAQTFESTLAHVPGVDVMMPSTATDAAGLLNAAFRSGRPTIFLYPKRLLNDARLTTSADVKRQLVPIGRARKARSGQDLTYVAWGNTVSLCERAADAIANEGFEADVIDLRSISPWDEDAVLASAQKTRRLVIVHEDNHTCGLGAEVAATVAERAATPVAIRRVTRPDTFIPCNYANQIEVLPSFKRVLTVAAELLDLDLDWIKPAAVEDGACAIEAIGSGPSDEAVGIVEVLVEPGAEVCRGQEVVSVEATKSVFEITSPESGVVEEILVKQGDLVPVGAPMMRLRTKTAAQRPKPVAQENPGIPVLSRRKKALTRNASGHQTSSAEAAGSRRALKVGLSSVATVTGSRVVSNEELLRGSAGLVSQDVIRRTGIERRFWVQDGECGVSMAVDACAKLLEREGVEVDELDLVVCSTTSPPSVTPSLACRILHKLSKPGREAVVQAYDVNAACSGYLYALQAGFDFLQSEPNGRILVVTSEVLSPLINPEDFDTAILFGDAASATLLYGEERLGRALARLHRPGLSARGEDGGTLSVPFRHDGYIRMKGQKVFSEAVRAMVGSLTRVCEREGMAVDDLSLVVPHQANQRIIDAIQRRIKPPVFSNIRHHGNTSSTTIPLCLNEVMPRVNPGDRIGLCAFGGGFTFGAGILEAL